MNRFVVSTACLLLPLSPLLAGESETPPDIELLEFLGSWQTPDGDYLDPLVLAGDSGTTEATTEQNDD